MAKKFFVKKSTPSPTLVIYDAMHGHSAATAIMPGADVALYEQWKANNEAWVPQIMANFPPPRGHATEPFTYVNWQSNYDGTHSFWRLSKVFETSNPTLSAQLLNFAAAMLDPELYEYPYNPTYPNPREGGLVSNPPFAGAPGAYNYNLGPKMLSMEPSLSPAARLTAKRLTFGYAAASAYSAPEQFLSYYKVNGDDTWPSATTAYNPLQLISPVLNREFSLAILAHIMADDYYAEFETRNYGGYAHLDAHNEFMGRVLWKYFLQPGAVVDRWRDIHAQVEAVSGDFTQVPMSWSGTEPPAPPPPYTQNGYYFEYTPWAWAHFARDMIFCYEDPVFTNDYNADILAAVIDLCDMCLAPYWQKNSPGGRNCLLYRIPEGGSLVGVPGAPDLALWYMPMLAWAWSKTANQAYYDLCVELCVAGNAEAAGFYYSGKWFNEVNLWAYYGFQWLGLAPDSFTPFWRVTGTP